MRGMKADDAEFIFSEEVVGCENKEDLLGVFENSFHLCNYENSHKRQTQEEEKNNKEEEKDEDEDLRTKRINAKISNYAIHVEEDQI